MSANLADVQCAGLDERLDLIPSKPTTSSFPTKTSAIQAASIFDEIMRDLLKEGKFLLDKISGAMPTTSQMDEIFKIFDGGACAILKAHPTDSRKSVEETCSSLKRVRANGFGSSMAAPAEWRKLTKDNTSAMRNWHAGQDAYYGGSCMECLGKTPDCDHLCCEQAFRDLAAKRSSKRARLV